MDKMGEMEDMDANEQPMENLEQQLEDGPYLSTSQKIDYP